MNLVAKEYVAAQDPADPGVLVLSRFAGAAQELDSALIVNPYDIDAVPATVARAFEMPLEERKEALEAMMARCEATPCMTWQPSFRPVLRRPITSPLPSPGCHQHGRLGQSRRASCWRY